MTIAAARATVAETQDAIAAARRVVDEAEEARRQHAAGRTAIERRQAEIDSEVRALTRRIEDDPGELLRRKFRYQYRQRQLNGTANSVQNGGQIW